MKKVEIACNNYQSCLHAYRGGADRIELIENLEDGGCTPSFGMMKKVKENFPIPIYAMIRPRGGNFVYSDEEFEIMKYDIILCREVGIDGIVFGVMNRENHVDVERCRVLLDFWKNGRATFHRAIDTSSDIIKSLEEIVKIGFERILTSGGKATAQEGLETILSMNQNYGNLISIMAGSGISDSNIQLFSSLKEVHATCKVERKSSELFESITYTDEYKVKLLTEKFKGL